MNCYQLLVFYNSCYTISLCGCIIWCLANARYWWSIKGPIHPWGLKPPHFTIWVLKSLHVRRGTVCSFYIIRYGDATVQSKCTSPAWFAPMILANRVQFNVCYPNLTGKPVLSYWRANVGYINIHTECEEIWTSYLKMWRVWTLWGIGHFNVNTVLLQDPKYIIAYWNEVVCNVLIIGSWYL